MTEQQYIISINKYRNPERTINKNIKDSDDCDGLLFSAIDEYFRKINNFQQSSVKFDYLIIHLLEKNKIFNENYKNNLLAILLGCLSTDKIELLYSFILIIFNKSKQTSKKQYIDIENISLFLMALSATNSTIKWILFLPVLILNIVLLRINKSLFSILYHYCFKSLYKIDMCSDSWYSRFLSTKTDISKTIQDFFGSSHPFSILLKQNNKY